MKEFRLEKRSASAGFRPAFGGQSYDASLYGKRGSPTHGSSAW